MPSALTSGLLQDDTLQPPAIVPFAVHTRFQPQAAALDAQRFAKANTLRWVSRFNTPPSGLAVLSLFQDQAMPPDSS